MAGNSTIGDHFRLRKPSRNQHSSTTPDPHLQSTRCKSVISSLLLSNFTNNQEPSQRMNNSIKKSRNLLGFGCTSQPEVSVPGVIRSSAGWEDHKKVKNERKNKKTQQLQGEDTVTVHDFWCGADSAAAASVDCVRPKIDLHKLHLSQRGSYSSRQRVIPENYGGVVLDSALGIGPDVFEARHYHHLRNRSPQGMAEILMFQNGLLMRRSGGLDRYREWRLDVDSMSYEELLELGDKIGHVNTGLGEEQIRRCLRKAKLSVLHELSSQSYELEETERKCSICQEEYEADDEIGKLECGHAYHLYCIKQWLTRKNACPVCKVEASFQ